MNTLDSKIPLNGAHASTSTASKDGSPMKEGPVKGPTITGFGGGKANSTTLGADTAQGSGNGKSSVPGFTTGGVKAGKI